MSGKVRSRTKHGSLDIDYSIGPPGFLMHVCKKSYGKAHDRGLTALDDIIKEVCLFMDALMVY